jgi:GT2 family glycosyltransferase
MSADVAIIVLARNGVEFTRLCLDGILASRPLPRQLIVVDNDSEDATPAAIAEFAPRAEAAGIELITWRNPSHLGCSEARNQAWERAATRYVVFLDNDCVVRSRDWLERLTAEFADDPALGIIGPKLLYPQRPHKIQCAGVSISPVGRVRFCGRGSPRDAAEFATPRRVVALISACWMMRNELRDRIGMLDPLFHPVQYEDLDLCMRVNEAGLHCAYTPGVEMYHFEGTTTAAKGNREYQRIIVANSAKFRKKWREAIRELPPDNADFRWKTHAEMELGGEIDLSLIAG